MLNVFTGSDTAKAKQTVRKLSKNTEVVIFGEGGEAFDRAPSYIFSRGLFSPKVVLILDRPFETADGKELLQEHAEAFHKEDTDVYVVTGPLTATDKKIFPKGTAFQDFESKKMPEYVRPNVFNFTDAFLAGDKKKTWIEYRKLVKDGVSVEEIHGALMWAVRAALISAKTKSASETDLKPFVYTKSKRVVEKIGTTKAEWLSRELLRVYHRARMGEGELELNLEHLILSN